MERILANALCAFIEGLLERLVNVRVKNIAKFWLNVVITHLGAQVSMNQYRKYVFSNMRSCDINS